MLDALGDVIPDAVVLLGLIFGPVVVGMFCGRFIKVGAAHDPRR